MLHFEEQGLQKKCSLHVHLSENKEERASYVFYVEIDFSAGAVLAVSAVNWTLAIISNAVKICILILEESNYNRY